MAESEDSGAGNPRKLKSARIYKQAEIDEAALRAVYEGGATISICMKLFGVGAGTIQRRLEKLGVLTRKVGTWKAGRKKKLVSEADLRSLYINQKLDIATCASRLDVGVGTIVRRMEEFGIQARPLGPVPHKNSPISDGVAPGDRGAYMKAWREKNKNRFFVI